MEQYKIAPIWVLPAQSAMLAIKHGLTDKPDLSLFVWFLCGQRDEDHPQAVVVPRALIQRLYGSRARVQATLRAWEQRTGIPMEISRYRYREGKATTAELVLPDDLSEMLREIVADKNRDKSQKVNLVSGERWTIYKERKARNERTEAVDEYIRSLPESRTRPLIETLNSRRTWNAQRHLWDDNHFLVQAAIDALPTKESRDYAGAIVAATSNDLLAYKQTGGNDRIYPAGTNMLQLPRDVRKAVFNGCHSLDLASCHLVIAGNLWGVNSVLEVVKDGVWRSLAADMGLDDNQYKPLMKVAVYTTQYGGGAKAIKEELAKKFPGREGEHSEFVERFGRVPWVKEIRAATRERLREIMADGHVVDARGIRQETPQGKKNVHQAARSLLAREISSYEVEIMLAAFEAAQADRDLLLVLWLHDGIYIQVMHNFRSAAYKLDRVKAAAEARAREFGFDMRMEIELLEGEAERLALAA